MNEVRRSKEKQQETRPTDEERVNMDLMEEEEPNYDLCYLEEGEAEAGKSADLQTAPCNMGTTIQLLQP